MKKRDEGARSKMKKKTRLNLLLGQISNLAAPYGMNFVRF